MFLMLIAVKGDAINMNIISLLFKTS